MLYGRVRVFGLVPVMETYRCGSAPDFDRTSPVHDELTLAHVPLHKIGWRRV